MPVQRKGCSFPGCDEDTREGRCRRHSGQAEKLKGSSGSRGYSGSHVSRFRARVLARDPVCVICWQKQATVADHYPKSRRQLVAEGLNPDDPRYGRGLCEGCDHRQTAARQPGGWNAER